MGQYLSVACQANYCPQSPAFIGKNQLRPAALPAAAAAAADEIETPECQVKIQKSQESLEKMSNNPYGNLSAEVQSALVNLNSDNSQYQPQNAHELFKLEQAVQIFFVTIDGQVSTFSAPETLRIFQFTEASEDSSNVFLQVGGWTQPLVPGASPCLQAENGAIMFPDIYSETPDSSVGLVISDSCDPAARQQLLTHLEQLTAYKSQPQLGPEHQLGALGSSIVKGCEILASGIEVGAEKAGSLIEYVTEEGQKRLSKAEEDVKVSGFVAGRVGKLTKSLATYLANKATPNTSMASGNKKAGAMAYLVDAARGGLIGYGTVYNGLENSAKVLGNNVKDNSVKIVNHKYGGEAGQVFGEACTAAGNAAMTYMNVQSLGVKGLVKKTAKDTGKKVVKNVITGKEERKSVTSQ